MQSVLRMQQSSSEVGLWLYQRGTPENSAGSGEVGR